MSIAQVIGPKPEWYGDIENAWFPKAQACDFYQIPSFEGYMNLHDALGLYPDTMGSDWEILSVDDVEECVIYWPETGKATGEADG